MRRLTPIFLGVVPSVLAVHPDAVITITNTNDSRTFGQRYLLPAPAFGGRLELL